MPTWSGLFCAGNGGSFVGSKWMPCFRLHCCVLGWGTNVTLSFLEIVGIWACLPLPRDGGHPYRRCCWKFSQNLVSEGDPIGWYLKSILPQLLCSRDCWKALPESIWTPRKLLRWVEKVSPSLGGTKCLWALQNSPGSLKAPLEQRDILWLMWEGSLCSGPGPLVYTKGIHTLMACLVWFWVVYTSLSQQPWQEGLNNCLLLPNLCIL